MASFDWQRKTSANFGEVWVPIAVVQLKNHRGTSTSVLTYIDSGAVVSLLRRSVAEELGLSLEAGRQIFLTNVGGSQTKAYVHELDVCFSATDRPVRVPFAFAAVETVPNLLGRQGLFEKFEITFDPTRLETRIAARSD